MAVPVTEVTVPKSMVVKGRRNPRWIALGIAALCLGALGAFFLYGQLAHAQTVVAIARTVYRGAAIQRADLTTITVGATPEIRTVPAAQLAGLIGKRAAFDLVAGSLMSPDAATAASLPAPGRSVVGVRLTPGRVPAGSLPASSRVRLVSVPPEGAEPGFTDAYSDRSIQARVVSSTDAADGLSVVLNVDVPADVGPVVGQLAAQQRLVVVWDAEG